MYGKQPWFDARLARRSASVGVACIGFIIVSLLHAPDVSGQVRPGEIQVSIVPEPGVEVRQRIDERMPRGLSWEDKRQRLLEEGVRGLPSRPTEFTLTPQQPWRNPGGYFASGSPRAWNTPPNGSYAPSGYLTVDTNSGVFVGLQGLRPTTQYLLDLSVKIGSTYTLIVHQCHYAGAGPVIATFRGTTGPQHVFIVLPTDASGNSCIALRWSGSGFFYKVEISELGPVR